MNQNKANKISAFAFAGLLILGLVLALLRTLVEFITNYQWFKLNGFISTYLVKIKTEAVLILPVGLIIAIGLYFYLKKLKNKYYHAAHIFYNSQADKTIHLIMKVFSLVAGVLIGITISNSSWLKIQLFIHSKPFGKIDPIFDKDIGFYIFQLPFYEHILNTLILLTVLLAFITVGFFVFIMTIRQTSENKIQDIHLATATGKFNTFFNNEVVMSAVNKLAVLGLLGLLFLSAKYYLQGFALMYSTRGVAYGASYTDIHVTLIVYRILSVVCLVFSVLFFISLVKKMKKLTIAIPIIIMLIAIGGGVIGTVVQQLVVEPNEISKEKIYLEYNIKHTQDAFALKTVNEEEFPVEQLLTWADIKENDLTVENIRINDARPLQQTYNQIQGIRLYYTFTGIDLDRYIINGKNTQVFISARELDQNNLDDQAKTWINKHLKYTHGYGIVMSPVNSVTSDGQPELLFKNIPPITDSDLLINRPEIYFGEVSERYVIINTDEDEFDYPSGSNNKTSRYEGQAGIPLSGINRLLYAFRERSTKLLVSSVVNPDSRILLYRNIIKRAKVIAPFLTYDSNPYLVLNQEDGKLYWIIDAYTTSSFYPYSQIFNFKNLNVNYIRNSVKVVIDAYEGTTNYYIYDEEDVVVQVYNTIFKDLFTPIEDFPVGLKKHIKYPQDYFDLQTEVFRSYHVNNPEVFYNGEDIWDVANEKYMDGIQKIESNYVMFKLPDSTTEEFALIVPYTPKQKANMTSLFVARNDGDKYGKLYLYKFPKDKTIQGPMMIESRIDQDSIISPQFTLWGQEGSSVLRGNLIVVPIENSLLYVEPVYIRADNPNSLPEMKRVIIVYQDKIIMEETLNEALSQLFDKTTIFESLEGKELTPEMQSLINSLNETFGDSKESLLELERLLNELNKLLED